ncbi:uncharacterized protein METZ01_LOCUS313278, partial [marine metagenome]
MENARLPASINISTGPLWRRIISGTS